jgi:pimeloyl-ACP methyl ester carboxylesterase
MTTTGWLLFGILLVALVGMLALVLARRLNVRRSLPWRRWLPRRGQGRLAESDGPLPTSTVDIGSHVVNYHRSGRGFPVLMLHGWGSNLQAWGDLQRCMSAQHEVWALDLPGFGQSSKDPAADYGLDEQAARVLHWMDRVGLKQVDVIGSSMGGALALWLARWHPERLRHIAVIAPAVSKTLVPAPLHALAPAGPWLRPLFRPATIRWSYGRVVRAPERLPVHRLQTSIDTYAKNPAAVATLLKGSRLIRDPRLWAELPEIKKCVLVLWGARDRVVPLKLEKRLRTHCPGWTYDVHPLAHHHVHEDDPDWIFARWNAHFHDHSPQD